MTTGWVLRFFGIGALACALTAGAISAASATPITFVGQGVVSSVDVSLGGTFAVNQTLDFSYTFESTTPARAGSDSDFAVFDALTALSFSVGGYAASSTGVPEIQVDDAPGAPNDRYGVVSSASNGLTGADVNGFSLDFFSFRLDDNTNTVFSDALVLPTAISLADFGSTAFFLFFTNAQQVNAVVTGTITSLTAVPEPGALALFAIGLVGLGLARRRRH